MYRWWELFHNNCDSEDVKDHTSFHFEKIDDCEVSPLSRDYESTNGQRGCPTSGCYGSNENPVRRTRFDENGTRGEEYNSYN
jgi:hypothetical protein